MWRRSRTTATIVVIADMVFTASAVVVQPITGIALAHVAGYSLLDSWIVVVGRALSVRRTVLAAGAVAPEAHARSCGRGAAKRAPRCRRTMTATSDTWFILGWPAFVGHDRDLLADDHASATVVKRSMTLEPLLNASPAIQIHTAAALSAFAHRAGAVRVAEGHAAASDDRLGLGRADDDRLHQRVLHQRIADLGNMGSDPSRWRSSPS